MNICVLGRQPELGLAELEALYGAGQVRPAGSQCAIVDGTVDFGRLGGSVKMANLVDTITGTNLKIATKRLRQLIPELLAHTPADGKIKLGISAYGLSVTPFQLNGEALQLKKAIRATGRSVRVVPTRTTALSSAQTYHNYLDGDLGLELLLVQDGPNLLIGRVTAVQDIDSYRIRDRERPKRDAFVGMLPPKLAQIIVNLACGSQLDGTVLDPFCGTGVVLQEAALMHYNVYGTDISERMVRATRDNINWLEDREHANYSTFYEVADATSHIWRQPVDIIATETYLGQPLGGQHPTPDKLAEIVHETNSIIRRFIKNIAPQLTSRTRVCLAVPAWFVDGTCTRLPVADELAPLGLTCHTFSHVVTPLIYHRENQVTGRELLVLTKE